MNSLEPKKLALLRILQILEQYSDYDHPLKQEDIARYLDRDYGIVIERKAIGRNIFLLKDAGYDIASDRRGSYLAERTFDDSELRMLIDGVLASRYITAKHSKELIERLCSLSNKYFRSHVKNIWSVNEWSKTDNQALFYNIEIVDTAIEKGKQIAFSYNKYGIDRNLHISARHRVSPYQMVLRNQHYFLMCYEEYWKNITFFRMDKITDIALTGDPRTPIREIKGYENGINYKELALSRPYMFPDKPEKTEILCPEWFIDEIIDWFGKEISVKPAEGESILVSLCASPKAMEYWAMQYADYAEVMSPRHLRERIKEKIVAAARKYK